jgi:hypothetical protein
MNRREKDWLDTFTEREQGLIRNACAYADGRPAGLPGHNLMIIIGKMRDLLVEAKEESKPCVTSRD